MLKKITLTVLVLLMVLSVSAPVCLADGDDHAGQSVMRPLWTYINSISNGLSIDTSGRATMSSQISTYSGTSVGMYNYLQRYQNGAWSSIKSWSQSSTALQIPGIKPIMSAPAMLTVWLRISMFTRGRP